MLFLFQISGTVIKKNLLNGVTIHVFSPQITLTFAVECRYRKMAQNVITVTTVLQHRVYRPHGITVKFPPPLR